MPFSVFRVFHKYGKSEKILEKSVLVSDFIAVQLGQFTTSDLPHQHSRGLHHGQQVTTFTFNHQPHPTIFMRATKDLQKWPFIISTSGDVLGLDVNRCKSISDGIINWPITTRKRKFGNNNFKWHEYLYMDISCMNNSGPNMMWEKTYLRILNCLCGALKKQR